MKLFGAGWTTAGPPDVGRWSDRSCARGRSCPHGNLPYDNSRRSLTAPHNGVKMGTPQSSSSEVIDP
jgi:hypothetical protein